MVKVTKIKGFADLFPPESCKYELMERQARAIFTRYGCQEVRVPLLEKTELFARGIGQQTDIVQKEMYTFLDRKGRSLTLRPEATAGLVRAFIENNLDKQGVCKFFTFGPMFRYERPQKGRMRQFHQIDVEYFGPASPLADGELILMLWDYLQALQLKNIRLELNSLGCKECRPHFISCLRDFLAKLPADRLCPDCNQRKQNNPLRVLDCKLEKCRQVLKDAPKITEHLCLECKKHFEQVIGFLQTGAVELELNPFLVRGLDYYQRTTFEVIAQNGKIGAQSAIAGGGRYDGLVKMLGGPDVPGLGFAVGMERVSLLLDLEENNKLDFYLAILSPLAFAQGLVIAQKLRAKGFKGEVSFEAKSLKSQLRIANKKRVKTCLILGEDEIAESAVQVKNMDTGVQQKVGFEDLEQALGIQV